MILDEDNSRFKNRNETNTPCNERNSLDLSQPSKRISKLRNKNLGVAIEKRDFEQNPIEADQEVRSP